MKRLNFILLMLGVNCFASAQEQCHVLTVDAYKKIIHEKERQDVKLQKLPDDAYIFPLKVENCYVNLRIRLPKNKEYDRQYLFDDKGELVDIKPSAGPDIMACKNTVNNGVDYYFGLLVKKRKENSTLPQALNYPKTLHVVKNNCLVSLYESYRDDPEKPLNSRQWVFDQNGNIVRYTDLIRNARIFDTDSLAK